MKNLQTFKTKEQYEYYYADGVIPSKDLVVIEEDTSAIMNTNNVTGEFKLYGGSGNNAGGAVEELPYEIVQPTDETHCDKLIAASGWKFIGNKDDIADKTLLVLKIKDGFDYNDYFVNISRNDDDVKGSTQFILRGNPAGQPDNSIDYTSSSTPKPAFMLPEYDSIGNGLGAWVLVPVRDDMQGLDFNYCILRFFGAVVANTTNFRMIKY